MSEDLIEKLVNPSKFWSRSEIRIEPNPVPSAPGVYAWWFDTSPCDVLPIDEVTIIDERMLLYVGKAKNKLRKRLEQHYSSKTNSSTLRLSLGAYLRDELMLINENAGTGKDVLIDREGKIRLTEWMEKHTSISWITCENPEEIELTIFQQYCMPLNIEKSRAKGSKMTQEKRKIFKYG